MTGILLANNTMSPNPSDFSVDPSDIPQLKHLPNYWPATESGHGTSAPPMFQEHTPAPDPVRSLSEDPNLDPWTTSRRDEMSDPNDDRNGHSTPINVDDDDESLFGGPSLGDDQGGNDAVAQDAESGFPAAVMIEDDDDLMIVEPEDVPAYVRAKFDEKKKPKANDELFVSPGPPVASAEPIKVEEDDDLLLLHHVTKNTGRASEDNDEENDKDSDEDYESDEYAQRSDGESSAKRRRRNKGKGKQKQVRKPEPMPRTQIRNVFSQRRRVGGGEKTLQGQPLQEPSDEELAQMFMEKERLSKLSKSEKLSLMDRMKLAAITAKIADLETLAQNMDSISGADDANPSDEEADSDAGIEAALRAIEVLGETENAASSNNGDPQGSGFGPGEQQAEGSGKKKRKASAKTAKEWWEQFYAEKEDNKSSAKGKKKQLTAARKKNKPSKGKKGITTAQERRLMEMLKNNNPIVARAAHGDVAMPGPIDTRRQDDQLQAMKDFLLKMSGNPTKRHRSMEMGELKRSIRSFGRGKVKPNNGR